MAEEGQEGGYDEADDYYVGEGYTEGGEGEYDGEYAEGEYAEGQGEYEEGQGEYAEEYVEGEYAEAEGFEEGYEEGGQYIESTPAGEYENPEGEYADEPAGIDGEDPELIDDQFTPTDGGGYQEYDSQQYQEEPAAEYKVQCWAKALYDFEGHSEAELTFTAGEAIGIFDPDPAQEWWFGETEAGARGSFPQNYVTLGAEAAGFATAEEARVFEFADGGEGEASGSGAGGEEELDEVSARKQKLRDDMNLLKTSLANLAKEKAELENEVELLGKRKTQVQRDIQENEKVANLDFVRLDLWQLVSALEAEGDTFALLETLNSGAAGEIALLRDMVGPALTGIGQPLLEEYAQSFEKSLAATRVRIQEDNTVMENVKQARMDFLASLLAAEKKLADKK